MSNDACDALNAITQTLQLEPPAAARRFVRQNADYYTGQMTAEELAAATLIVFRVIDPEPLMRALARLKWPLTVHQVTRAAVQLGE